jgi:SAM-dependent methyltransferase
LRLYRAVAVTEDEGQAAPEIDARRANVARVYDYWLGGTHNFLADQDVARAIAAVEPMAPLIGRANRAFIGRAVRFLAASGVRQFLDIGSGIPTQGNVHEIAQQADPAARVVYADIDPVAVAHSKALLQGNTGAAIIQADLREPDKILSHDVTRRLIDPGQPTGLLLVSILHFLADAEDPWRIVATLRDALAPGSFLVISHGTNEDQPDVANAVQKVYNRGVATALHLRSHQDILRFFDGFTVVDPGLVYIPQWRPDPADDIPENPSRYGNLVGVGQKTYPPPGTTHRQPGCRRGRTGRHPGGMDLTSGPGSPG